MSLGRKPEPAAGGYAAFHASEMNFIVDRENSMSRGWRRWFAIAAVMICALVAAARLTGPSDLHDQTQEKTSAYTTDLALHAGDWRRWVLPMQQGAYPATKPPLYNWLATPLVQLTQGRWEWPHRLPSLLAYLAVCAVLWRLGDRIDPKGLTGPLAAMILASNYAWFKLSVLVRPDTLLSMWLVLGWIGATAVVGNAAGAAKRNRWRAVIWIACALAALTKGPPALLIPMFIVVLGWFTGEPCSGAAARLRRAGRALRQSGALWGLPLVLGVTACWLGLVWWVSPDHLYDTLIREEFVDRAMGTGAEGVKHGPWDLIRTALNMPLYFVTRFLPWSIFFFGALIDLRREGGDEHSWPDAAMNPVHEWMRSGVIYTLLVVVAFTVSAGKRADYIASAYVSASLVTAWCLTHLGWRLAARQPGLVLAVAALTTAALIAHERINGYAVKYPLAESLRDFARQVRPEIEAQPHTLEFYRTGVAPLQVMLHRSQPVLAAPAELVEAMRGHEGVWLIVADRGLDEVLEQARLQEWSLDLRASSTPARGSEAAAPLEMRLYLVRQAVGRGR